MRKGIVMEQGKNTTIVMTNDGHFYRAERLEQAEIGMEVQFQMPVETSIFKKWTNSLRKPPLKIAVIALVFLLAFFPVYSWYGSNQAYAYVNIDINPSVEMKVNDRMQVLNITPRNKEAEEIVSLLNGWEKRKASEVTFEMIHLSQEKGYINNENNVLIGISYIHADQTNDFSNQIEDYLNNQTLNLSIAAYDVPEELRKQAHNEKKSVNEFMARRMTGDSSKVDSKGSPVEVESDDKEIIQSFFKQDHPPQANDDKPYVEQKNYQQDPLPGKGSQSKKAEEPRPVDEYESPVEKKEAHGQGMNKKSKSLSGRTDEKSDLKESHSKKKQDSKKKTDRNKKDEKQGRPIYKHDKNEKKPNRKDKNNGTHHSKKDKGHKDKHKGDKSKHDKHKE